MMIFKYVVAIIACSFLSGFVELALDFWMNIRVIISAEALFHWSVMLRKSILRYSGDCGNRDSSVSHEKCLLNIRCSVPHTVLHCSSFCSYMTLFFIQLKSVDISNLVSYCFLSAIESVIDRREIKQAKMFLLMSTEQKHYVSKFPNEATTRPPLHFFKPGFT